MTALEDLHRKWAQQSAEAQERGRQATERYGEVNPETFSRVAALMRPALENVVAERRAAEAAAIAWDAVNPDEDTG